MDRVEKPECYLRVICLLPEKSGKMPFPMVYTSHRITVYFIVRMNKRKGWKLADISKKIKEVFNIVELSRISRTYVKKKFKE